METVGKESPGLRTGYSILGQCIERDDGRRAVHVNKGFFSMP